MALTLKPDTDLVWKIGVDDTVYELHPGDVSASVASALRLESNGWRVGSLLVAAREAVDPDVIVGLLFLAMRQSGDTDTSYGDVVAMVDQLKQVTLDFGFPELVDDDPGSLRRALRELLPPIYETYGLAWPDIESMPRRELSELIDHLNNRLRTRTLELLAALSA